MDLDKLREEQKSKTAKAKSKADKLETTDKFTIMNAPGFNKPYVLIGEKVYRLNRPIVMTYKEALRIDNLRSVSGRKMFIVNKAESLTPESIIETMAEGEPEDMQPRQKSAKKDEEKSGE